MNYSKTPGKRGKSGKVVYKVVHGRGKFEIKSLWEKLNAIHRKESVYFKRYFEKLHFRQRMKVLTGKRLRVETAELKGRMIGYCVSSMHRGTGEIESLIVDSKYRGYGVGKRLVSNALRWFKKNHSKKEQLRVVFGHESVLPFYMSQGFFPREIELRKK
ncbi:MAG: GNAT family N-acetyltransferase [Endomicrobiales bacterium]|nr:GNAT family N-acetyltransferase [Endomicrobiales bacterium]